MAWGSFMDFGGLENQCDLREAGGDPGIPKLVYPSVAPLAFLLAIRGPTGLSPGSMQPGNPSRYLNPLGCPDLENGCATHANDALPD
jgi:hypothetical protein